MLVCPLQQQITAFDKEDFVFALGGPEPDNLVDNFQLRGVNLNQLPALAGQGISMALVNLGPCAINLPHIHPRATEVRKKTPRRYLYTRSTTLSGRKCNCAVRWSVNDMNILTVSLHLI